MCADLTEVRIVAENGDGGHLTWWWPTTMLDTLIDRLGHVRVRDSVGAVYSGFQAPGTLVFDRDGVRFEVVARLVDPAPVAKAVSD
jgi:hypothetical protein